MQLSRLTIYIVIGAVALSVIGLINVQLKLIRADVEVYQQQFKLLVPEYISDMQSAIRKDKTLRDLVNSYKGPEKYFVIESFEDAPDDQILMNLKKNIDAVFDLNKLNIDYELKVIMGQDRRCFFYSDEQEKESNPRITEIVDHDNFMCLCGPNVGMGHGQHGAGEYTALDVSIDYPNELGGFVGENGPLLRTSLLLLLILIAAFSYTVITINKQKKLSDLKNDFINNLTHEFKTPIFSISLASGLLRKSEEVKQSARLLKYTELIDNEGKRLKSQVDKILQMALIDSGNFKLDKKQLNLHDLIERVSKNFELIINEQKGQLTLDLSAESASIFADETHLNNIIYNLLDNAVKYTEKRPEIVVSTANTDEGIILIIKDNGIGMSEQVQKFIFDKFYRAGSGDLHNVKGFGLGLSYVKSVIEAHKGGINLNSKKNEGSEFNIYLPLR
ncbi:HAMP domain-containing sensor histidine kinase [Roseivirga sp. E12]|uniref:sensor histidine kinase n=1 Tax=Roseivirga sp. E12 TaxID=2819237 RepID=UPI001ABBF131|nr:HAMP domain-containing histidine kinase [Roseivirga sp. E12]